MKKILLLDTSVATLNMGDEIIHSSIQKNWPELMGENYVCTFPTHTPPFSWWQSLLCKKKIAPYKDVDYKFLCGTNALYTNMVRPFPTWNINLLNCGLLSGTILVGVGAGVNSKNVNAYTRCLYRKVLSKDYIHSVRDEFTKDMLEKIGFRAYNTGCPTLWGLTPDFCKTIPQTKANRVVFTLTGYHPDVENDRKMVEVLGRNYEELLFWPQTISDLDYLDSLGIKENIRIITPSLDSYDKALSENVDYVGNRLHGGIRALQHGRRSIIISIDYRALNMSKQFSIPILKREDVQGQLDELINTERETKISGLDFDLINKWKSQFVF